MGKGFLLSVGMVKKFTIFYTATLLLMLLLLSGCTGQITDDVVARVNGQTVTSQDVDDFLRMVYLYMPDLEQIYSEGANTALLEEEIIWLLIEHKVLKQELDRLSLKPDEGELDDHFQQFREELIRYIYETEENYLERLQELELNETQLKLIPGSAIMRELLFQHVTAGMTEEDAKIYAQENPFLLEQSASVYVYRILLESEQEALEVRRLLEQGANFVELGKKYSLDGFVELGYIRETDIFDPFFIEAAFQLEPGELSQPVETPQGYYIILVTEKEEALMLDFEQAREGVMAAMQEEYYEEYFYRVLQESKIEIF